MNTITRTRLISTTALALLGAGLPAKTAFAQTADAPIVLAPIVVTGTKRPQDDAKLPVATTILDQSNVPPATLDPITEIARQSPGTNFLDFGRFGESYMTMRGLSTLGTAMNSLDSVIGISVDGVPTTLSGIGAPILDMERVEVLKGPQGTTFGRNAFAGAINIVSKPADGTRETILSSELGSDGHAFLEGTTGGWLLENVLAGRGTSRITTAMCRTPSPARRRAARNWAPAGHRCATRRMIRSQSTSAAVSRRKRGTIPLSCGWSPPISRKAARMCAPTTASRSPMAPLRWRRNSSRSRSPRRPAIRT
jgi:hypothetical protein